MKSSRAYQSTSEWLDFVRACFPSFLEAVAARGVDGIIIGAALLDVYPIFGYPITPTRRTTDLDVSIGIGVRASEYQDVLNLLLENGYQRRDESRSYRLYPPHQIAGDFYFIDLLAHPGRNGGEQWALDAMGIAGEWNFEAIDFALTASIPMTEHLQIPNILSFLTMKAMSWQDDPYKRAKDIGDIVDVVYSLVSSGSHYQLTSLWRTVFSLNPNICLKLKMFLERAGDDSDVTVNFEDFKAELMPRGYSEQVITDQLSRYFRELALVLED